MRYCRSLFSSNSEWTAGPYCTVELSDQQEMHHEPHRNDWDLFWDTEVNIAGRIGQRYIVLVKKLKPLRGYELVRLTSDHSVLVPQDIKRKLETGGFLPSLQDATMVPLSFERFDELVDAYDPVKVPA